MGQGVAPRAAGEVSMENEFLEILNIASVVAGASRAVLTRKNRTERKLEFLANTSREWAAVESSYAHPNLSREKPIALLPPKLFEETFDKHPLKTMMPQINSLATYYIFEDENDRWALTISNPAEPFFSSDTDQSVIERLVVLLRGLIKINHKMGSPHVPEIGPSTGLADNDMPYRVDDSALQFLKDTLVPKARLLSRKSIAYLAVRAWSKPIKAHQIKALTAIKQGPTRTAACSIAREMGETTLKVFGTSFDKVVPMPFGSSGRPDCLSVAIGEELSRNLNVPCENILRTQGAIPGKSHPKKSSRLAPFHVDKNISGRVLLVDDVATSGKHIEMARVALEKTGCSVSAIVWISD